MKLISMIKLQSGSIRKFAIDNDISYSVLYDICHNKKSLLDCSYLTVKKIAKGLGMTTDELVAERRFPQFRDALHNGIKQLGDIPWLIETLKRNQAIELYRNGEMLHAIYLVDMIDYVCDKNNLPVPSEYQEIRELRLAEPYYVGDLHIFFPENVDKNPEHYIPEFARSNIMEGNIYDAI